MTSSQPDCFIVRILEHGGQTVGLGALIGPRHIMTCAHVVNAATGVDQRAQAQPTGTVLVDFPLLYDPAEPAKNQPQEAHVARWLPPPREGAAGDDVACLVLVGDPPRGAGPGSVAVNVPAVGHAVRVFGFPGAPSRPDGSWVASIVQGRVAAGRIQLDSGQDAALRVQPGFSGSPVYDDATGRIAGLLAAAPAGHSAERDSYAIGADRLASIWPEILQGRSRQSLGAGNEEITVLHLSDLQIGRPYIFGGRGQLGADQARSALYGGLHEDLSFLASEHGLRPDLMVVTGGLTATGSPREFREAIAFLNALCEAAGLPKRRVAIVPGNHDVNRKACEAYFTDQESEEEAPVSPYWPKWRQFSAALETFYEEPVFTPDEPWTLFQMPDLAVVVAGLNSTWAQSHRDGDQYGLVGEEQLAWFADRLAEFRDWGWLRLAAIHHCPTPQKITEDEKLRDAIALDERLGRPGLVNLLLHGHADTGRPVRLASGLVAVAAGSPVIDGAIASQYQLLTPWAGGYVQHARGYDAAKGSWTGDSRVGHDGSRWRCEHAHRFSKVDAALSDASVKSADVRGEREDEARAQAGPADTFLDRVAHATGVSFPRATIISRPEGGYLRVANPLPDGGAEQWPVGVAEGLTEEGLGWFIAQVHARFASADPSVRSEFVYAGPPAPGQLVIRARQAGVRLRSFVDYQGLIDLRPLAIRQAERLASDQLYPAHLYVPQRYRMAEDPPDQAARLGLVEQSAGWLSADAARLVMVLGDFGRGKTSFLRQLTRILPSELPGVLPILVELRRLEKAPSLDELLAQHLVGQGIEDISPAKLRYMITSGRLALLFDGFDELELRVGYANAADYLQVLLQSVTDQAKFVLTSRTQHFLSTSQIRTALGERVAHRAAARVVILEDFADDQILEFLTKLYDGDASRAAGRFELLRDIHDLLGLARNPRMLAFIAALDEGRLRDIQDEHGQISAAELYREIISYWLTEEAERQRHRRGLRSLGEMERLEACTTLALRSWLSGSHLLGLADLSAGVSATLGQLADRGFSADQASHAIGSGSLLVRTDEGSFAFIHQSIMEWLVAAVARALSDPDASRVLSMRPMSKLMVDFFIDLAGRDEARRWAVYTLADAGASEAAKQNALAIEDRLAPTMVPTLAVVNPEPVVVLNLAGIDLRGQDLSDRDLRQADLREANLQGMRLERTDLSGADLRGADLTGCRMVEGSLSGATLAGSIWNRASLLGTALTEAQAASTELAAAAIVPRDRPELMLRSDQAPECIAFSPDGALLAMGSGNAAQLIDLSDNLPLRILHGHTGRVTAVAFSPDGVLLATASHDGTARIWDLPSGITCVVLQGHVGAVVGVAFSPDGALLATVGRDRLRIWDSATGVANLVLSGHTNYLTDVAYSPDGTMVATASIDRTARIWDAATGATRAILQGHLSSVTGVAFSPDCTMLATASEDRTARIWDAVTGATRATLEGHSNTIAGVAFSPDGALLATACHDGTARIWDTAIGVPRMVLRGHISRAKDLAFSPDGALLATSSYDGTIRIWHTVTGTSRAILTGYSDWVTNVAFSPDGALLVTASDDSTARLWDAGTGMTRTIFKGHSRTVTSAAFSPTGILLATASQDGTALIWETASGAPINTFRGHTDWVTCVAFSADGALLATASDDRTVRLWDTATGAGRASPLDHDSAVTCVKFSPDGALLATGSQSGIARIWRVAKSTAYVPMRLLRGNKEIVLQGHLGRVNGVAFSPDGALLATASDDFTVRFWDTSTGETCATLEGHSDRVTSVEFSPSGTLLATASYDGTAQIWDSASAIRATFQGHTDSVTSATFSPDGRLLATSSHDGTARIWDIASGRQVAMLVALPQGGYAAFGDDGYKLEGDPTGILWWAIKLCRFAPGELDPYVPELRRLPAEARLWPA